MTDTAGVSPSGLRGFSRLAFDATAGLVGLVETMHLNIARAPVAPGTATREPTGGMTRLVYRGIRGAIELAGGGIDALLGQIGPSLVLANARMKTVDDGDAAARCRVQGRGGNEPLAE